MICNNCGKKLPEGSRFCEFCGAPVLVESPKREPVLQPPHPQGGPGVESRGGGVPRAEISLNPTQKTARIWIWIVVVALVALSCCCVALIGGGLVYRRAQETSLLETISNSAEDPTIVPEVSAQTPVPEEQAQPAPPVETDSPQIGLSPDTLLAVTQSGIWVVNEETREATPIRHDQIDAPWNLNEGMAPDKKFFSFITGFGGASVNPMLVVLDIENQTSALQLELTGPIIQPGMEGDLGDPAFEAHRAMQSFGSLAWSPDATRLAFIGARDGDSADVYLFDQSDNSVTRLTDEAGHATGLHWSPDGQKLQYVSVHSFGTGAGSMMEGLWVYEFQNHQAQLIESLESSGEEFLGWTDESHFLIASWNPLCEFHNLRLVNSDRLFNEVIVDGCFTGVAYDPEQRFGMFSVTEFNYENCNCGEPMDAGLRIFGEGIGYPVAGDIGVKKYVQMEAYTIGFIPQGNLFTVYGDEGLQSIFSDKGNFSVDILPEVKGLMPYPSPTGDHWAWASAIQSGLWITTNNHNPVELSSLFSGVPLWSQDGKAIYFFENNRIFTASAPEFDTGTLVVEIPEEILGLVK